MKISFTLNQLEKYALSETRYQRLYDSVRSHLEIPDGCVFTPDQLTRSVFNLRDFIIYHDEGNSDGFILINGVRFDLVDSDRAIRVHTSMIELSATLKDLHIQERGDFRAVRKARADFIFLLDQTEW